MSKANDQRQSIIIHYGEIGLKGKNRPDFVNQLAQNIRLKLKGLSLDWSVYSKHGYLTVEVKDNNSVLQALEEIQQVFGIAWIAQAQEINIINDESGIKKIENEITKLAIDKFEPEKTFAVRAHRPDKTFPLNSHELEVKLGKTIQDKTDWDEVNLDKPDQTFYVDVHRNFIQLYTEKTRGFDGLPVGTAGHVISLLSGGIDSPVASWLMGKRGAEVDFLHFAATNMQMQGVEPQSSGTESRTEDLSTKNSNKRSSGARAENYLISQISQQISKYTLNSRLFIVPYIHFNLRLMDKKVNYELVLFRRFMMRVAEKLAEQIEAQAIVTGDNLAQVASQTMPNLASASKAVDMPILRPLITYNKQETIALAKQIDTYELSIKPYKDCCSLISDKPKTISEHDKLSEIEEKLLPNYEEIINQTLNDVVVLEFENGKLI